MGNITRCEWCAGDLLYQQYHDEEWGVPLYDDQQLFEFLILEGAQAGLSWITVLRKREAYRKAFNHFDIEKIARYTDARIEKLLLNSGIIRNRLKVQSTRSNARAFLEIQQEFGSFSSYVWDFVDDVPIQNHWENLSQLPASTAISDQLSKTLKKRGFKFVGPTIMYAFMQATGMVNDHTINCHRHLACQKLSQPS